MSGWHRGGWLLLLGTLPAAAVETLPDPTRPPPEIARPAAAEQAAGSGLQSVIIAPGRRAAIINGQTVELGGKYENARLIEVTERGVVLRGPQGRQVLELFPGVEISKDMQRVPAARSRPGKAAADAPPQEKQ
jgi:MSHA biogenesis protein MshK